MCRVHTMPSGAKPMAAQPSLCNACSMRSEPNQQTYLPFRNYWAGALLRLAPAFDADSALTGICFHVGPHR
jgi:hypothetical protein